MRVRHMLLSICLLFTLSCGRGTDAGRAFVPEQGHPDPWASHLSVGTTDFHGTVVRLVPPSASSGEQLFLRHCAPCHGSDGSGKIGPNIQLAAPPVIKGAIQNLPVMRGHAGLSEAQVQDIASHVATLVTDTLSATGFFDTSLCAHCHGTNLDGGIARVSCYSCHNGPDGRVGHPEGWLSAGLHASYGRTFIDGCKTCHRPDLNGGGVPASPGGFAPGCPGCHNGVTAPLL